MAPSAGRRGAARRIERARRVFAGRTGREGKTGKTWVRNGCDEGNAGVPDRGEAAAAADDPFAVQQPRNLPARAGVERLRRLRQAALRGPRPARTLRGRRRTGHPHRDRPRGAHADGLRQRHRVVPRRGRRAPRHDCALRDPRVLRQAVGRPGQGRAADRPVRRRLLFGLHRRRPGHRDLAARRAGGGRGGAVESDGRRVLGRDGREDAGH